MLIKLLRLIFVFIFSNFFLLIANAEIVKKIDVIGNDRISSKTIILFSNTKINEDIKDNDLNNIIKNLYETNYFKNVEVSLSNQVLSIIVEENSIIGNIEIKGVKAKRIKKLITDTIKIKSRSSFNQTILKKDKETIGKILRGLGYYFSKVSIILEDQNENISNIVFDIDLGKKTKIRKITFTGDKFFKDNKLKSIIVSEEYKFWKFISGKKYLQEDTVKLDKRLLKNFYLNKGFYNVKINSSFAKLNDEDNFELIFSINANNKYFFNDLTLNLPLDYDKNNYSEVTNLFAKLKNKPYSISRIEKIINTIDKISITEQFESTKSTVKENIIDNKINIEFNVEDAERIVIKKINILGNNITKENVIRNRLEIDEGDLYNEILALKSINNLRALNFFKTVDLKVDDIDTGFKVMNITVEEKPTGELMAGAGFGTGGSTLAAGVKENNYLGKGISLDTTLSIGEDSIKGKFSIENPNYNNSDKSIYSSIQAIETNKLSDFGYKSNKTGVSVGTAFEFFDDLNLGLGVDAFYEKIETDSTASSRQKNQAGDYFDTFINMSFNYDKRDQRFQTTEGFLSNYSVNIPLLSDSATLTNKYILSNYFQYFDKNIIKSSLYLKTTNSITGENIKLSERNYIPSSRLRGFEFGKIGPKDGNDYIGGNFVSALNFSTTIPQFTQNLQSTDVLVFLDIANMWGVDYDSGLNDSGKIRSSIGIGLDWFSPVGPLNFSLAQPISKGKNDITETFRFNIGTTF